MLASRLSGTAVKQGSNRTYARARRCFTEKPNKTVGLSTSVPRTSVDHALACGLLADCFIKSKSAGSIVFAARNDGSVNHRHGPLSIPWRSARTSRLERQHRQPE